MKALLAAVRGLVLFAAVWTGARAADAPPPIPHAPVHWVTDDAGLLSAATARDLDDRLRDYERRTGHQVLVYITKAAVAPPVEDWTVRAFAKWKVGRKALDDGVILFVFPASRTLRVEVGYGLEPVLPDVVAARIVRETIAPGLRAGDPDRAVTAGVDRLLATIGAPGQTAAPAGDTDSAPVSLGPVELVLIGLGLVVLLIVAARSPRMALFLLVNIVGHGGFSGTGGFGGGGGFSGGGGRSGGGGASGRW